MKKLIATLAAVTLAGGAFAANLDVGTKEVKASGTVDFDTVADTLIALDVGIGTFPIDNVEVGVEGLISDDDIVTTYGIGVFSDFFFPMDQYVIPYAGVNLALVGAEVDLGPTNEDSTALQFGIDLGGAWFITEDLAVDTKLLFRVATDDIYAEQDGVENTDWRLVLGLRYFFDM